MKVTVLGCGSSGGVPLVGNDWGKCDPANPRNRRLRVSILVEREGTVLLVDTTPDARQQLLNADVRKLDGVLYTHAHADHCHGIDELRSVNWLMQKPVDIYGSPEAVAELLRRFPYIFEGHRAGPGNFYKPSVQPHVIDGPFRVGAIDIVPFVQDHGDMTSLGFRFGDFAYTTDAHALDDAAFDALRGIKTWVVDCVRDEPHPTHAHVALTMAWIERVKPERAYLTHMNHMMDYDTLRRTLPRGVEPAYDGLVISC